MKIVFHMPTEEQLKSVHGGSYYPRCLESRGVISKEEADRRVSQARIARRLKRIRSGVTQANRQAAALREAHAESELAKAVKANSNQWFNGVTQGNSVG